MAKKKSHLDFASMSPSELEQKLEEYEAELVKHPEDKERREWLLNQISEIKKELLRSSDGKDKQTEEEQQPQPNETSSPQSAASQLIVIPPQYAKEFAGESEAAELAAGMDQSAVDQLASTKLGNGIILAASVVDMVLLLKWAPEYPLSILRTVLFSFSMLTAFSAAVSLIWNKRFTKVLKVSSIVFVVSYALTLAYGGVEALQGKRYWDANCLCFEEKPEVIRQRAIQNFVKRVKENIHNSPLPLGVELLEEDSFFMDLSDPDNPKLFSHTLLVLYYHHNELLLLSPKKLDYLEVAVETAKNLFKNFRELEYVAITIRSKVWDFYRREVDSDILTLRLDRDLVEKMQWHNFTYEELEVRLYLLGVLYWHVKP
uniref:Uncharacterized protein n=1 Tax=Acetithermum autotrophicum TaxID=1446466 RepID=H5STW0_ACEAU|nr:hypothetical protein HGMM_OP4C596 [Candidatus Acetothermum autotrophicum]